MTNLLIKHFIKDYKSTSDAKVRGRYGMFAGIVGIISNFLLFIFKITVGMLFDSISITADAINNLSDCGSSAVSLMGFKISGKPADAKHPFGHGRMEYISGLIVSFIILLLGFQLVQSSVNKIIHPRSPQFGYLSLAVLIASILIKLWQCLFFRRIGKTINSLTLIASSQDSRNDMIATSVVLLGSVITRLTGFNLDGYMGISVALFIIISGIKLVSDTISPLLGSAPNRELTDYINKKIMGYEHIIGTHDLAVHSYGPSKCFASLHCEVPAEQDIMLSHDIIDNIEHDFLKDGIHLVIHLDPVVTNDEKTNELKKQVIDLLSQISPFIGMHDFRVVWGISHTNLIFDVVVPYDFYLSDEELIEQISHRISLLNKTYLSVITVDHDMTQGAEK